MVELGGGILRSGTGHYGAAGPGCRGIREGCGDVPVLRLGRGSASLDMPALPDRDLSGRADEVSEGRPYAAGVKGRTLRCWTSSP